MNRMGFGPPVSTSAVQRLYKRNKIKFKKVYQRRINWKANFTEKRNQEFQEMKRDLLLMDEDEDCEIFQVDETVFIGADHQARAWSNPNDNLVIGCDNKQEAQSAKVIGALSNKGTYLYRVQEDYFVKEDIVRFIKFIKSRMRGKAFVIFWDNCKTHRAHLVRDFLTENDISVVFNIPYSPQYNGIESLWAY